jgi:hypothetical protein
MLQKQKHKRKISRCTRTPFSNLDIKGFTALHNAQSTGKRSGDVGPVLIPVNRSDSIARTSELPTKKSHHQGNQISSGITGIHARSSAECGYVAALGGHNRIVRAGADTTFRQSQA